MEKEFIEFEQRLREAPAEVQRVVLWMIGNIDFVEELTREPIPEAELTRHLEEARQKEDYLLWALCFYSQQKSRCQPENQTDDPANCKAQEINSL